ncbi:unknown [Alistipes sp. CAG:157]|nr:unknown [Alistipes sp. CAG:157]
MISAPMVRWVSMTFSGVKRWREPSIWELKRHPSSVSLRHCASENTWKPPLSVSIGLSHVQKQWTPPAASMTSMPGRR